jgi:NAD(P)-dependent dehydrogenase (short-subunit alcohol dehydrogenase family)
MNRTSIRCYADGETSEWRHMLEVNVLGLSICTREAIRSMKERGVTDGHIVHINRLMMTRARMFIT